jgi:hypothetical protein
MVSLNYNIMNLADFETEGLKYEVVGLIYAHFPAYLRKDFHQKVVEILKSSGYVIFEAFHKNQLNYASSGQNI